jgi:MFS family permease
MASLLGVSLLARTAITASVMALTMYVVLGLHLSYAAAGGVAAALDAGLALGGPLLGRRIDRHGSRVVMLVTVAVQCAFWLSAPALPYPVLLAAAFPAGLLMVPAQLVTRQAIAAMTTEGQRQAVFALESVQGELAYVAGPPLVILCAASLSPGAVAWGVGAALAAGGVGIALLDPPLRTPDEAAPGRADRPRRREWLGRRMVAVLVMAFGTTVLLSGTDLAIVAKLQDAGQVSWATLVVAVYGTSSIVGGLVYGARRRPLPASLLLGLLAVATVPAGLASSWPGLCVAGVAAGLLTAPTLSTATDAISRLAPAGARGEATGLQSSALGAGFALGAPLAGMVIDSTAPAGGFATAGIAGLAAALLGGLLWRGSPPWRQTPTQSPPTLNIPDFAEVPDLEPCGAGSRPAA